MIYFLLISNPVDSGYNDILLYAKYSIRPLVYHIAGCATRDISAQMDQKVDINDALILRKALKRNYSCDSLWPSPGLQKKFLLCTLLCHFSGFTLLIVLNCLNTEWCNKMLFERSWEKYIQQEEIYAVVIYVTSL